jgi:hypothetical protein
LATLDYCLPEGTGYVSRVGWELRLSGAYRDLQN